MEVKSPKGPRRLSADNVHIWLTSNEKDSSYYQTNMRLNWLIDGRSGGGRGRCLGRLCGLGEMTIIN